MLKNADYANLGQGSLYGSDQFKKEHSIPRQESTSGSRLVGDMNWRNLEESSVCKINSKPIEIYFIIKRKGTKVFFLCENSSNCRAVNKRNRRIPLNRKSIYVSNPK